MTEIEAADIWSRNVREIRAATDKRQDAVYSRWLRTGMLCTERDALMRSLRHPLRCGLGATRARLGGR